MPPSASIIVRFIGDASSILSESQRIAVGIDKMSGHMRASAYLLNQMGFGMLALGTTMSAPLIKGTKAAIDLEYQLAQVQTIMSDTNRMGIKELEGGLTRLSTALGIDAVRAARAAYDALSSAIPAENLLGFVEQAGKAAVAGASDIDTSVKVLASVINAYGDKLAKYGDITEQAAHVSDVLFQTVNLGVLTYSDLAAQLGDVVSTAANAGVSLEELGAAFATITLKGVSTAETATSINNMLIQLISPSKDAAAAMDEMGIEFRKFNEGSMTLTQILAQIIEKTGGLSSKMTEIFPNIRAFRAGINLSTGDGLKWNSVLAAMYEVTGLTDHAYRIMAETMQKKLDRSIQLVNSSMRELGKVVMPMLDSALSTLTEKLAVFQDYVAENGEEFKKYVEFYAKFSFGLVGVGTAFIFLGQIVLSVSAILTAFNRIALAPILATLKAVNAAIVAEQLGLMGMLGAWTLVIAALQLAGFFIYADVLMFKKMRDARNEHAESEVRLQKAIDESIIRLKKHGAALDEDAMAEMSLDEQRTYLFEQQKKRSQEEIDALTKQFMEKRRLELDDVKFGYESAKARQQARALSLNDWITAEEAARVAVMEGYTAFKNQLLKSNEEETDNLLRALGVRTEAHDAAWKERQVLIAAEINAITGLRVTEEEVENVRRIMAEKNLEVRQAALVALGNFTEEEINMLRTATEEELLQHQKRMKMSVEYAQELNLSLKQKYAIIDATAAQNKMDKLVAEEKWEILVLSAKYEVDIATATLLAKKELSVEEMKMVEEGVEWREIMEKRLQESLDAEKAGEKQTAQEIMATWREKRVGIASEANSINTYLQWMQEALADELKATGKNSEESIAMYKAKKAEHKVLIDALKKGDAEYRDAMIRNWYDQLDVYLKQQQVQAEMIYGADQVKTQLKTLAQDGGEFVGQFLQYSNGLTAWWASATQNWDKLSTAQQQSIRNAVGSLPEYHQAIQASWATLTDEQKDKMRIMVANLESWGVSSEDQVKYFVNALRFQSDEAHDAWFKFAPSTPGSPAPTDVFNTDIDNMVSKLGYMSMQTKTALTYMHGMWLEFSQSIEAIAKRIYDAYQYVNPWASHSPSLVSEVRSGTDEMRDLWAQRAKEMAISVLKMYKEILYYQERGMIKVAWAFDIDPNSGEKTINYDKSYFMSKPKDLDLSLEEYAKFLYDMEELERARLRSRGIEPSESRGHTRTPLQITELYLGNLLKEIFNTDTREEAAELYFAEIVKKLKGKLDEVDELQEELQDELLDTISESGKTLSKAIGTVTDEVTTAFRSTDLISAMQDFTKLLYRATTAGAFGSLSLYPGESTTPSGDGTESTTSGSGPIVGGRDHRVPDGRDEERRRREELQQALDEAIRARDEQNNLAKLEALRKRAVERIYDAIEADAELAWSFEHDEWLARDQKLENIINSLFYAGKEGETDRLALTMEELRAILRDILNLKPVEAAVNTMEQITEDIGETTEKATSLRNSFRTPGPGRSPNRDRRAPQRFPDFPGQDPPEPPVLPENTMRDTLQRQTLGVRLGQLLNDRYYKLLMKDRKWTANDVMQRLIAANSLEEVLMMSDAELVSSIDALLGPPKTLDTLLASLHRQTSMGGAMVSETSYGLNPSTEMASPNRNAYRTGSQLFTGGGVGSFAANQVDRFERENLSKDEFLANSNLANTSPVNTNIYIENIPDKATLEALVQNVTASQARAQRRR